MEKTDIRTLVHENYAKGFHCAESVMKAVLALNGSGGEAPAIRAASGLCGGIGRCKQDLCGALSGGVLALGMLYGRDEGDGDIEKLCALSREFRDGFINKFGSTNCGELISIIEKNPKLENCRALSAETAALLHSILEQPGE